MSRSLSHNPANQVSLQLYHALMAFSALSMSYNNGVPNLDALQHYQQALPSLQSSLRTEHDLTSDGVFLTHFILLLYEVGSKILKSSLNCTNTAVQIAAGEPRGLSLWSQHIDQLLRITLLRRKMYSHEPYSFIIWWVASIDTHVVLSGMSNGDFIETMLRNNMLPSGMDPQNPCHTYDYNSPSRGLASPNAHKALPSALAFHRRISVLAAELGLLARDIRAEEQQNPNDMSHAVMQSRHERIGVLQDTLRRTWNVQMPVSVASGYCNQILPVGARGIFEHVSKLFSLFLEHLQCKFTSDLCRSALGRIYVNCSFGASQTPNSSQIALQAVISSRNRSMDNRLPIF